MVELKALILLEDVHLAQAMNYLEAYNMEIGLLINFGAKSLQFKRVHNNNNLNRDLLDSKDSKDFLIRKNQVNPINPKNQGPDK